MTVETLVAIGLSESKAKETLRNPALSAVIFDIIKEAQSLGIGEIGRAEGALLYHVATRLKKQCAGHRPLLLKHIRNGNIRTEVQLTAAMNFLLAHAASQFEEEALLEASGVGARVSANDIEDQVAAAVEKFRDEIVTDRYDFNVGRLMGEVRQSLKWADGGQVKKEVDLQILTLIGPRTPEELTPSNMKKSASKAGLASKSPSEAKLQKLADNGEMAKLEAEAEEEGAATIEELMKKKVHFHKPGENYKTEGYVVTADTMSLLKNHLEQTGGKVVTRFPPEPNGILHIGHAKAININFGYAKAHGGVCYLRYDDTNPEKEEERFFVAIREMVEWLGYTPYRVTHSSDYFRQLYEWAVRLIESGDAYVCHQPADQMKGFNVAPSPWRHRPVAESLALFEDMKHGKFDEGEATLRMKVKLEEGKLDPVAYRIKYFPHHRTGNKWCIYPTYDYTHCLCDSAENISHSLCTKEFQSRRSSYYWLCNALRLYCPVQWEYARLNMRYTVVSKRKIGKLIAEGIVRDWDDPRLFTLPALRRRGFPAEALNNFVAHMGLSTALTAVDPQMLDACARDILNRTAPRVMAVLDPVKVTLTNFSESQWPSEVEAHNYPAEPERGSHKVPFDSVIYIDRTDFKEVGDKGFKRLTRNQPVGLKYVSAVVFCTDMIKDQAGQIVEIQAKVERLTTENKPKGFIQWVAQPLKCQVRLYDRLFQHKNPEDASEVPGGFITDCNKDSLVIMDGALIDQSVQGAKVFDKFQFERIGYFSVDTDSTDDKLVFNRTVLLKEDSGKQN